MSSKKNFLIIFLLSLVICLVLCQAVSAYEHDFSLRYGNSKTFDFTPIYNETYMMSIYARVDYPQLAGGNRFLKIKVNNHPVTCQQLVNKDIYFYYKDGRQLTYCEPPDHWNLFYSPNFHSNNDCNCGYQVFQKGRPGRAYEYVFNITDFIEQDPINNVTFENMGPELIAISPTYTDQDIITIRGAVVMIEYLQLYGTGLKTFKNSSIARFTLDKSLGQAPLNVSFDASGSEGTGLMYSWDFGDGTSGQGMTVSHEYKTEGTYTARLTVTDQGDITATGETIQKITVTKASNKNPVASFTMDKTSGSVPFTVAFDASGSSDPDGSITTFAWDFGDGKTGSGVMPSHTFESAGTYRVSLMVTDNEGAWGLAAKTLTANEYSTAGFTTTPTIGISVSTTSVTQPSTSGQTGNRGLNMPGFNLITVIAGLGTVMMLFRYKMKD